MFQEDRSSGIQLYDCHKLQARITPETCTQNKKRAQHLNKWGDVGHLYHCLNCSGLFGGEVKEKFKGLIRCAGCRGHKHPSHFGKHHRTGVRKVKCRKCEENQRKNNYKRRKGRPPAPPPRLNLSSYEVSLINGPAIKTFGLQDHDYYCVYWSRNEIFLHAAQEKHPGYYGFRTNSGSQAKKCSARAIRRAIGVEGEVRYLIHATDDPLTFRLEEENPATGEGDGATQEKS